MQVFRFIMTMFVAAWPLKAMSEVNCSIFDAIERVQFAQARLSTFPVNLFASPDTLLIRNELKRMDVDEIAFAHDDQISPDEATFLVDYIGKAQELSSHIDEKNLSAITGYFATEQYGLRQQRISRILPRLKCNTFSNQGKNQGGQRVLSSVSPDEPGRKITFEGSGIFLATVVLLFALGLSSYQYFVRWRFRKQRRSKRFHTHIETQINAHGTPIKVTILDLSCNGAKVQILSKSALKIGDHIEIWIINCWHPAQISWANLHYMGLKFDRPLPHEFVQTICAPKAVR